MTPREVRQPIESIDRELARLEPWLDRTNEERRGYVLDDSQRGREAVFEIDHGVRFDAGQATSITELADGRHQGRIGTETAIGQLRDRWAVLLRLRPTNEQVAAAIRSAEAQVATVRQLGADVDQRTCRIRAAVRELLQAE
jgi:hypothetical protein